MDANEGITLAKAAVAVLLVILVIGAIIALVYLALNWYNSGSDKLSDQVNSITASSYSQYDDAQVSGTKLITSLDEYRSSDISIIIANKEVNGGFYTGTPSTIKGAYAYCAIPSDAKDVNNGYTTDVTYNDSGAFEGKYTVSSITTTTEGDTMPTVNHNTNFSPVKNKGTADTYVKRTANWYANLVYDESTGDVCGILFQQMD